MFFTKITIQKIPTQKAVRLINGSIYLVLFGKSIKEEKKKKEGYEGKGVVIMLSDPNALLERLDLLLASQEAGHTGVRNELVSICDELKRQGVLDTKAYKKLNSIIKNDST